MLDFYLVGCMNSGTQNPCCKPLCKHTAVDAHAGVLLRSKTARTASKLPDQIIQIGGTFAVMREDKWSPFYIVVLVYLRTQDSTKMQLHRNPQFATARVTRCNPANPANAQSLRNAAGRGCNNRLGASEQLRKLIARAEGDSGKGPQEFGLVSGTVASESG
jgi:hypothetical protein